MNLFDLQHAITACQKELDETEDLHFAYIKATSSRTLEALRRARYDGFLDAKHAALALIATVSEYCAEKEDNDI